MEHFPALFSPIQVGDMQVKNRIVMAPMLVGYGHLDGRVSQSTIDYYETRARGGAGLIIVEAACIDSPAGQEGIGQLNIDNSGYVEGLAQLSKSIKKHGARAFIQLFHAGRQTSSNVTGQQPVAPSAVPCRIMAELPRQLEIQEIQAIEEKFIEAAVHARTAGFEGVEIHAAHGYLVNQFLSQHSNQRSDSYGGSLENRMRILLNIIKGIKMSVPDLAISVRINIDDFVPGGLKTEESSIICHHLEQSGVNLINCTCGTYESGLTSIEPASYPEGWRIYLAEEIKKAVSVPVAGGGMISSPGFADELIEKGRCDLVFLGRSLLAEADWPNRVRAGDIEDIRPCIRCNHCIGSNFQGMPVSCTVNPHTGRERQFGRSRIKPEVKFRVAVIGSGPAGLQTAISLSRLCGEVILYEKEAQAGGLMNLACLPPHKHRVAELRNYLFHQLDRSKVKKIFCHEFTIDDLNDIQPDSIVVATGSIPLVPDIEGLENSRFYTLEQILTRKVQIQGQHAVVIGGGENGCETADFLIGAGKEVTIIEQGSILAPGMEKKNRRDLMDRLQAGGVVKRTSCQVIRIKDHQVWISDGGREPQEMETDAIVLAVGYQPYHPLYKQLRTFNDNLFVIGDALRVRGFKSAILEGEMTAFAIARKHGRSSESGRKT
ncbi:2,4-dienoyl-coa reductase [hydrocarbon metagenome]|uniref:2,4-dienoyl-coa reductase n=1 Tax=hydrocarbon metagenome TaxID=938273 RepID=A0A0W8E7M7_9ZZZZ